MYSPLVQDDHRVDGCFSSRLFGVQRDSVATEWRAHNLLQTAPVGPGSTPVGLARRQVLLEVVDVQVQAEANTFRDGHLSLANLGSV